MPDAAPARVSAYRARRSRRRPSSNAGATTGAQVRGAAAGAVDTNGDGVDDVNADFADQSGNGVADVYAIDFDVDNVPEVIMYDTNENGYMDSHRVYDGHGSFVVLDLNENGFEDTSEASVPSLSA